MKKIQQEPASNHKRRRHDGYIECAVSPRKPGKRAISHAKALALETFKASGTVYCPCCRMDYRLASVAQDVAEQGYCGYCHSYINGLTDTIVVRRLPTLREVITHAKSGAPLTETEAGILLAAYRSQKAASQNASEKDAKPTHQDRQEIRLKQRAINLARRQYHREGEIEIDEHPMVSLSDDEGEGHFNGAYVQGWLYISFVD